MTKKLFSVLLCAGLLLPAASSASPTVRMYVCFGKATEEWEPNRRRRVQGTNRADVIVVRNRRVVVNGRGGNDRICLLGPGSAMGGSGHDLIHGGRRSDRLAGGSGMDYIDGGSGTDRLNGGPGSDTLVGSGAGDLLQGGPGNASDYLFGGPGPDELQGADGADVSVGGEGGDALDGGAGGSDTATFEFELGGITVDLSMPGATLPNGDTLAAIENVRGSAFADTITGTDAANALWGGDGDDVINALGSFDVVDGGAGADTLDGGADSDRLSYLDLSAGVTVDLETGTSGEGDILVGFENLLGSAYDDQLGGDAAANELTGSRGSDQLFGLAGDDTLSSGGGDAGEGQDTCSEVEGEITNCELPAPVAPIRRSSIDSPLQGATVDREAFTAILGTGSAGQVALRRSGETGCYWWSTKRYRMEPGHCERPLWVTTKLRSDGSWSKQIPVELRLVPGTYEVRSRIVAGDFKESTFHAPYNLIRFRLQ